MTATATATAPSSANQSTTWNDQFTTLKARYPHVRDGILVALHIITQNPDIALDDAKAQAAMHGARITAASVAAAQRLRSRQDAAPVVVRPTDKPATKARVVRPARRPEANLDVEALIRATAERIQAQGSAEADRLRDAMRQAIAVLEAASRS